MQLSEKVVLVTGASRGIGTATVRELLSRGVKKVYAGARNTASIPTFGDARVIPIKLDITSEADLADTVARAGDVDIVINNAGTAAFTSVLKSPLEDLGADFQTNVFGTLRVMQAFAPILSAKGGGTIANVISIVALAPVPPLGGYSASKAALQSVTQSARTELKAAGVKVLGIYPGPIDTELARDLPMAKATPETAAARIVAGIEKGDEYIFTDPVADTIEQLWRSNAPALEAALAGADA